LNSFRSKNEMLIFGAGDIWNERNCWEMARVDFQSM
jgi:hypothetical protein